MKKLERARLILRKEVKKKRSPEGSFLAVHLLNDPQVCPYVSDQIHDLLKLDKRAFIFSAINKEPLMNQ